MSFGMQCRLFRLCCNCAGVACSHPRWYPGSWVLLCFSSASSNSSASSTTYIYSSPCYYHGCPQLIVVDIHYWGRHASAKLLFPSHQESMLYCQQAHVYMAAVVIVVPHTFEALNQTKGPDAVGKIHGISYHILHHLHG